MNRPLGILLFLILATVVGCQRGDKPSYANVKGTVTFNGKPIEKGQITFAMEGRPPSTMDIDDGKFNGQAMVGSNKVSVSAKKKVAVAPQIKGGAGEAKHAQTQMKGYMEKQFKGAPGEFMGPPIDYDPTMVDYIPLEWGLQGKQTRVVEAGSANEFEFNIKGKN
jgi:hypothetical protein